MAKDLCPQLVDSHIMVWTLLLACTEEPLCGAVTWDNPDSESGEQEAAWTKWGCAGLGPKLCREKSRCTQLAM